MTRRIQGILTELKHAEAYCHMRYRCTAGHSTSIWNSRDGVTPFVCGCPVAECAAEAKHIDFHLDNLDPDYRLRVGDYFWRDGTFGEMLNIVKQRIPTNPEDLQSLMKSFGVTSEAKLADVWAKQQHDGGGWPQLDRRRTP